MSQTGEIAVAPETVPEAADVSGPVERNSTEVAYIGMMYHDMVDRIAEIKDYHWQIVRWVVTLDTAIVAFKFSAFLPEVIGHAGAKMPRGALIGLLFVIFVAGVAMYEVFRHDQNIHRRLLQNLRRHMGGVAYDLYREREDKVAAGRWMHEVRMIHIGLMLLAFVVGALLIGTQSGGAQ